MELQEAIDKYQEMIEILYKHVKRNPSVLGNASDIAWMVRKPNIYLSHTAGNILYFYVSVVVHNQGVVKKYLAYAYKEEN